MKLKKLSALLLAGVLTVSLAACGSSSDTSDAGADLSATSSDTISKIESALDISQNDKISWTYDSQSDSWTMSITSAVTDPEIEDDQGVSVNVPGAYVKGIDTDGDDKADVTADDANGETTGILIVDEEGSIINANGQTYTAMTAPVIINTGAAGYSEQQNQQASSQNAAYGYINVACGNRGKQSTAEDEDGNEYYTGDAPLCLVDQKNAIRFVKYNILLGNLPGNVDYFVSTGGSGGEAPSGNPPEMNSGEAPSGNPPDMNSGEAPSGTSGGQEATGGPDAGTTQASGSATDSSNYESYEDMLTSYKEDISSIEEGDKYGNNIVELYDPLTTIGADTTDDPTWTRIVMGASEGDISMLNSLNLQLAWLNAGTDAVIEWQWDGGHVPSEIFGDSLSLYIDQMYGKYVDGATEVKKTEAEKQTTNGDATEATGTDISGWVSYKDGEATFSLADAASYRTNGANKAIPGFDVIDYGQETYEFGNSEQDARHFDKYVLKALQDHADELENLFNQAD